MSDYIIKVENLGKKYRIRHQQERQRYVALRDVIANGVKEIGSTVLEKSRHLVSRNGNSNPHYLIPNTKEPKLKIEEFWALKEVSFEVKEGEVVGIIGRNGAGKSTLLKILSRITEPTEGRVRIRGRVASLLEVGTGFHPELSGRENIFLNGAVLGMTNAEIKRRFDEIVAFAETEKFLDTPVKRYSSGMYVRLAFAVAAHLEPEVLLVDEVLAVGDAAFQKKCLGKMGDVAKEGRTVVFVSHSMGAVNTLTGKCIYLRKGQLVAYGLTTEIIEQYLMESVEHQDNGKGAIDLYRRKVVVNSPIRISGIWIDNGSKGEPTMPMGCEFTVYIQMQVFHTIWGANLTIILKNAHGERVATLFSGDQGFALSLKPGERTVSACVRNLALSPGQYLVNVGINQSTQSQAYDVIVDLPLFRIFNNAQITHWLERPWGVVHCDAIRWQVMQ
jgi:lipopolysaccharide transport system ATP-binding protein